MASQSESTNSTSGGNEIEIEEIYYVDKDGSLYNNPSKSSINDPYPLSNKEVIFETKDRAHPVLNGEYQSLDLINYVHIFTQKCSTVAKFINLDGTEKLLTSDNVSKVIGVDNYTTLLRVILTINNKFLKVKALTSLLTPLQNVSSAGTSLQNQSTQTETRSSVVDDMVLKCYKDQILTSKPFGLNIEDCSGPVNVELGDGSVLLLPYRPKDLFHLAVPDILSSFNDEQKEILINEQAKIDWELCLQQNQDGYYPIHVAVINDDSHLVKRLGLMMQNKGSNVDILTADGLTPAMLSIHESQSPRCLQTLLQLGADPLLCDENDNNLLNLAAELDTEHLRVILDYMSGNAERILKKHPELCSKTEITSPEEYRNLLFKKIGKMYNNEGYNCLMVAAKLGSYKNVKHLSSIMKEDINIRMPNTGDSALYLAVSEACMRAAAVDDLSDIPKNYSDVIEILLQNGAETNTGNYSGAKLMDIINEFNIKPLTLLFSKNLTRNSFNKIQNLADNSLTDLMLIKERDGQVNTLASRENQNVKKRKTVRRNAKTKKSAEKSKTLTQNQIKKDTITDSQMSEMTSSCQNVKIEVSLSEVDTNSPKLDKNVGPNVVILDKSNVLLKPKIIAKSISPIKLSRIAPKDTNKVYLCNTKDGSKRFQIVVNKNNIVHNSDLKRKLILLPHSKSKVIKNDTGQK